MKMLSMLLLTLLLGLLTSCGEEPFAPQTQKEEYVAENLKKFSLKECSNMHYVKPPVDLLFVVDNSGSASATYLNDNLKSQIAKTIEYVSQDFDYHIYVAPLKPLVGDDIHTYPLIVSSTDGLTNPGNLNIVNLEQVNFFAQATGNNDEHGFLRVRNIIDNNRSNGIFRNDSNTIVVMISTEDDNSNLIYVQGNPTVSPGIFEEHLDAFKKYTKKYADNSSGGTGGTATPVKSLNLMKSKSFRFISLVSHSNCKPGFQKGINYMNMSQQIYNYMEATDDASSTKDSRDICQPSQYQTLFAAVNNSIQKVQINHHYDHWPISSENAPLIQADDITVKKILANGSEVDIAEDATNGFQYLGFVTNQNTRYLPDPGEPKTGLMIKLNGTARVTYPECILAKTRTPTEFFGYIVIPRKPEVNTIEVYIDNQKVNQSASNGWSYEGYKVSQNIKVVGPNNEPVHNPVFKTGYFLKLNGSAVYSNGDRVRVLYKPGAI